MWKIYQIRYDFTVLAVLNAQQKKKMFKDEPPKTESVPGKHEHLVTLDCGVWSFQNDHSDLSFSSRVKCLILRNEGTVLHWLSLFLKLYMLTSLSAAC